MKKIVIVLLAAMLLTIGAAFADSEAGIRKIAKPIAMNLMKAMEAEDYDMYIKNWSENGKKLFTKEKFMIACKELKGNFGKIVMGKFVNILTHEKYTIIHWRVKTIKQPGSGDYFIRLVLSKKDGKYQVEGHFITRSTKLTGK